MRLEWEGEREDAAAAARAADERADLRRGAVGGALQVANEFSEITVRRVDTRNGSRLLIESPRSGQWIALCPLELEALTWQTTATFSAMVAKPFSPLISDDEDR
ncbi:MAG TPA: hypothetical protein VH834_19355 [Solirubrobacteraceae bacterium]|jgi:hypothetical protein